MRASQVFRYRTVQDGVTLEKLLEDFREDCTRLAGWRWR